VNQGTSLIQTDKGKQVKTSWQLSADLKTVTGSLREMKFTDPKLQEFQSSFVKVFETLSQSITKASQALNTAKNAENSRAGREQIEQARIEIDSALTVAAQTSGHESDSLGKQLNKYCIQPR
jgi:transcription elongation factor GreA-like protein